MKQKPELGGWVWWIFLIGTGIASFFTGWFIGKLLRRVMVALAVPLLVGQIVNLVLILPTAFGVGWLVKWLEGKWFAGPVFWVLPQSKERKSA